MNEVLPPSLRPGWAQRQSDWLVIPLHPRYHVGEFGIDNGMGRFKGVKAWEEGIALQCDLLDRVCREFGFNAWEQVGVERDV